MNTADAFLCPMQQSVDRAIEAACRAIAPSWPLERFIAVNPYWGWIDRPFDDTARHLSRLSGTTLRMPRGFYRKAWRAKAFDQHHLRRALGEYGIAAEAQGAIAALDAASPMAGVPPLLSDVLDEGRDLERAPAWRDTVTHEISQFCAAYFDAHQADWHLPHEATLFSLWRSTVACDHGIALLMHAPGVAARAARLPHDARQAIAFVIERLGVSSEHLNDFLTAVLLRINGWAAWCAYLRWQAGLDGGADNHIVDLLAIRLSWEFMLDDDKREAGSLWSTWRQALARGIVAPAGPDYDAAFQRALELAYQTKLGRELANSRGGKPACSGGVPSVQAIFCIDVRSELFRRALEHVAPGVQTMGFAGFFGLPVNYTPLGTCATRPQLPGLLAPALSATDSCGHDDGDRLLAKGRRNRLAARASWRPFQRLPGSAFTLVEALGIGNLGKLIRRSLPSVAAPVPPERIGFKPAQHLRPRLTIDGHDGLSQRAALAQRILHAMSLTDGFARIVLFAGHGSQSANNAHAAALDCGACCGQTGEVNARLLAGLLNDGAVRQTLLDGGITVPATTHFLAALHNTTTDEVELFDTELVPPGHADDLARLQTHLVAAGDCARAERAPALGLEKYTNNAQALLRALKTRANDWAQTRPEWGLANNAAFIVAPRTRSQDIKLAGRAFLHDYDWASDADGSILELIMTAPMIVTHWINMQYFASTVDPARYGSGNKLLHNVVGGHIGVFEGNGGDLRIGLPMQSLHDGTQWMHTPLRLSVFIEAPRAGIEAVIKKHEMVRHLIDHRWIYLFRIDAECHAVEAYAKGEWTWQDGEGSQASGAGVV